MISKPQTSQEILWCQAHWVWWLPPLTCSVQLPGSLPRADFTTSPRRQLRRKDDDFFPRSAQSKEPGKQAVLPLPVCAHTCHEDSKRQKKNFSPHFFFQLLRDVLSVGHHGICALLACWCIYFPSKMAMENSPLNKKNPVTLTIVLDYQIRRTMTSLPDKAAGTECFCTFAWKGPKKKHNGKFTQLQCTLFHSHCTIIDIHCFFPEVYTSPYYIFRTFFSLTRQVWLHLRLPQG